MSTSGAYGAARFNQMRRRRTYRGSPVRATAYGGDTYNRNAPAAIRARASAVRTGGPSISSSSTRAARGGGVAGLSSSLPSLERMNDRVYNQLVSDFQEAMNKQQVVSAAAQQEQEQDLPWWKDTLEAIGGSPVGSLLHQLNRPRNAIYQMLENLGRQEGHQGFGWQDLQFDWDTMREGLTGGFFYRGDTDPDTGERIGNDPYSGAGEIYEAIKENPEFSTGTPFRALEESHPAIEQRVAQGIGLGGELAGPNIIRPAFPNVLRGTGKLATAATVSELSQNVSRRAVEDVLSNTNFIRNNPALSADQLAANVERNIDESLNSSILDVAGGGAPHIGRLNGPEFPSHVSTRWEQAMIDSVSGGAEADIIDILSSAPGTAIPASAINNPVVRKWLNEVTNILQSKPRFQNAYAAAGANVDDVTLAILQGGRVAKGAGSEIANVWDTIREGFHVELADYTADVYRGVENPTRRSLGVRIAGTNRVAQVPVIGRAFGYAGSRLGRIPGVEGIGSRIYENMFPGIFANRVAKARAYGKSGYDTFLRDIREHAHNFTAEEGRELAKYLEQGIPAGLDPRKAAALKWMKDHLNDMHAREGAEGARVITKQDGTMGSVLQPDYFPLHLRGGSKRARADFLKGRSDTLKAHGSVGEFTTEAARKQGLRPVDDAFQALNIRYMKMANDITNSYFWQDLVNNYALMGGRAVTGITDNQLISRGLKEVEYSKLNEAYRQMVRDGAGKFYIPKAIDEIGKNFDELGNWSINKWGPIGRSFATIMGHYKRAVTIPFPGFHNRNFIGDTLMGLLDGVNPAMYVTIINKWLRNKKGLTSVLKVTDNWSITWEELMSKYRAAADSGFINIDAELYQSASAGRLLRQQGRKIAEKATKLSDQRELLPRVTHFYQALKDEAEALARRGVKDPAIIERNAIDAAIWRVNHYKFDYAALTPFERSLKTTAFPFYTYMRKAIPTLAEQMFINPKYFTAMHRLFAQNDGSAADAFNYMNMPDWIQDFGYADITDERDPLVFTGELFPTNAMDVVTDPIAGVAEALSTGDMSGLQQGASSVLSKLNPFLLAGPELAAGRTFHNNMPIEDWQSYLLNKLPAWGETRATSGALTSSDWVDMLNNRLGAGIPVRRVNEQQQAQQMETNYDELVENPLKAYNQSQDRFSISMNNEGIFQIFDSYTESVLPHGFRTPQDAISYARQLPRITEPDTTFVNRPPNMQDYLELQLARQG